MEPETKMSRPLTKLAEYGCSNSRHIKYVILKAGKGISVTHLMRYSKQL